MSENESSSSTVTAVSPEAAESDATAGDGRPRPRIQSVARASDVMLEVARSPRGLTTKQITEALGMSRQGAYHLIHTLVGVGMLARTEDNRYVLGLSVGTLAAAFGRHLAPPEHLAPHVRSLASKTGESAYAAGWQRGEVVVLSVARGDRPVQAAEVVTGNAEDGHARASGKLLLAHADPAVRDTYLATHEMRRRTQRTITDRAALEQELERVREQGYSLDDEEFADGLCCLAAPLHGGASPFVLGLSIPADRYREQPEIYLRAVLDAAATASRPR